MTKMTSKEHDLYVAAINRLSEAKLNEIESVCYANVAGMFAKFCNPSNRGSYFSWERFIEDCAEDADLWMIFYTVRGNKKYVNAVAKRRAKQIAELMVDRSGFLKGEKNEK